MKRLYGIDLLKMVAMLMVVMIHVSCSGGVVWGYIPRSLNFACMKVFLSVIECAVDCFVLATGYVMCRHDFRYSRIFKLWAEVVFYGVAMIGVVLCAFPAITVGSTDVLHAMMPVSFYTYWFFTEYVGLFFCIPFLNRLLEALGEKGAWKLIITGFCVFSLFGSIHGVDMFRLNGGASLIGFMYLYLLAGTLSMWGFPFWFTPLRAVIIFIVSALLSVLFGVAADHFNRVFGVFGGQWSHCISPFRILESISMLFLFARIEVKNARIQRFIAYIAPSTFSVYILHSNQLFRRIVDWNGHFSFLSEHNVLVAICGVVFYAITIFCCAILIDVVRRLVVGMIRKQCNFPLFASARAPTG